MRNDTDIGFLLSFVRVRRITRNAFVKSWRELVYLSCFAELCSGALRGKGEKMALTIGTNRNWISGLSRSESSCTSLNKGVLSWCSRSILITVLVENPVRLRERSIYVTLKSESVLS